jgi:putative transposase
MCALHQTRWISILELQITSGQYMPGNRRSIRLPEYDYTSAGAYFVTICAQNRQCIFGDVHDHAVVLSPAGITIHEEWMRTQEIRPHVKLDYFVIMPNHLHGILIFTDHQEDKDFQPVPSRKPRSHRAKGSLGSVIAGFKSSCTTRINQERGTPRQPVWQTRFWDRVVRNDEELERLREYIKTNPFRWELDSLNPRNV